MTTPLPSRRGIFTVAALVCVGPTLAAQLPTLQPKDYGRFERPGAVALSPHGRWIAYEIVRVDERAELRVRRVEGDSTRVAVWGSGPVFAADGGTLAWTVGVSPDERKRLAKEEQPIRNGLGILRLAAGTERTIPAVEAFAFDATGRYLAAKGYAPKEPDGKGADLRVFDLIHGTDLTLGNVAEFAWSEVGSLLALAIATGTDLGNGVQVYAAPSGRVLSLAGSGSSYRQLAWREEGPDLATLRSVEPASKKGTGHELLAWRRLSSVNPTSLRLDPKTLGLSDTLEVVEHRRPAWSADGSRISLGLRPIPDSLRSDEGAPAPADSGAVTPSDGSAADPADDELPTMQIWHTSDVAVIPQQQARARRDTRQTLLAVWTLDQDELVVVGTDLDQRAEVLGSWTHAVEHLTSPYPWGSMFGRPYQDTWLVDLADGRRTQVLDSVRYVWASPAGGYLLWFDGRDYWTYDIAAERRENLTARLPTAFADTAYDTPTDLLPPHGVAGWIVEDGAVFLHDQFDVWRVAPDGAGSSRLTDGAGEQVVHRAIRLGPDDEAFDGRLPLYVSIRGEWSERRGFARVEPGGTVERLAFDDRYYDGLVKADSAAVLLYRAEARDVAPDFFVADMRLDRPRRVSAVNPFMDEFAWGRTELIEFHNERGRRLQGVLLYPANHDPRRRYPMIVYTYEILSPRAHVFDTPSERDYYDVTTWTQQGYFVLLPDIVFRARDPGVAVVETLRPAVATVIDMGLVDSARVGLIGHSWGGYNATFAPTRTNIFAASVAGAPLTDFVSFMGQMHWTPGVPELNHWETGQARMEVPYWEDPEAHHRNSPIHKVQEMETPLLMAHGDKDGVVEFFQSTEFYNFARRAGKQMVLLVYEGENHGFVKKANQIDYHRRILEWFGHYLKGEPAAPWIERGIPLDRLDQEKRRVATQDSAEPPPP